MPYADHKSSLAVESSRRNARAYYKRNREKEIARSAAWNRANAGRVKELSVIRRSTKLRPEQVLFNNAKNRAKANGLEFNLELSDLSVPQFCPVLGLALKVATGFAKDNSPSVDRIDSKKGYVKGNVCVISHKANTIKSNANLADLLLVVAYMERCGRGR
jgi:hypothetical protein